MSDADPRIVAALNRADELADDQPEQHVAIYEDVHETLQQVLAEAGAPASDDPAQSAPPGADAGT